MRKKSEEIFLKKLYPGEETAPPFFNKRKPHRLIRVEKTPEPWPMPERAKPRGEHSEGFFFTPTAGNSLLMRIELRTCWGATLPDRASQPPPGLSRHN